MRKYNLISSLFWLASAVGALIVLTFVFRRDGGVAFSTGDLFLPGSVAGGVLDYAFSDRLTSRMPGWEAISWQVVIFLPLAAAANARGTSMAIST